MNSHDIAAYLEAKALAGELVSLPEHTPTVEDAARVVGTTPERIVKSVLFLVQPPGENGVGGQQAVMVIANGTHRVDYRRVADHVGLSRRRIRLAGAEDVLAITGYPVGAVPPFGHPHPLRTLIDRRVLEQAEVYAGGGEIDTLLRIAPSEIVRATGAETVDVVEAAA
jgi:prolyl-tRNA editing enzyme YbaK/EbsC (Cys-tRNA(Pro) deacylase)